MTRSQSGVNGCFISKKILLATSFAITIALYLVLDILLASELDELVNNAFKIPFDVGYYKISTQKKTLSDNKQYKQYVSN